MIIAACIALVCLTLLVALVLVLRHLAAMRATTGELAELRSSWLEMIKTQTTTIGHVASRVDDLEKRLVHLNNRTQQR